MEILGESTDSWVGMAKHETKKKKRQSAEEKEEWKEIVPTQMKWKFCVRKMKFHGIRSVRDQAADFGLLSVLWNGKVSTVSRLGRSRKKVGLVFADTKNILGRVNTSVGGIE